MRELLYKAFIVFVGIILFSLLDIVLIAKPSALQGRHFLVGFMQNEIKRSDISETVSMSIFVSSTQHDTITITYPEISAIDTVIAPHQILELKVPVTLEVTEHGIFSNKLVDIRSKHPIICWAFSSKNQSSDSYVVLPIGFWGKEYRIISMPNDMYNGKRRLVVDGATDTNGNIINAVKYSEHVTPRAGEFMVISNYDNTLVTYTPTANTRNNVLAGHTETVTLNKGEVLLVQSQVGNIGTEDLTGTLVQSNNPVGIISGHVRTAIHQGLDNPYDTKDHIAEMLYPTNTWGKKFVSVPYIDGQNIFSKSYYQLCPSGDLIRIVSRDDNTTVNYFIHKDDTSFINKTTVIKKAGDFFDVEAAAPIIWEADKPIMVAQFMMHKGVKSGNRDESIDYDPSLAIIPPIEQYIEEVSFSTPNNNKILNQYKAHCVIIITDSIGIYNLFLDGNRMNDMNTSIWKKRIGNSKYYWAMQILTPGNHKLTAEKQNFSGIIYGHGLRDSYAMTLGCRINDPQRIDTIPPTINYKDSCGKLHIKISDIYQNDTNATGIDWGYVKNIVNYNVQKFKISDTATIVNIYATPIDYTKNASMEIEFVDKNCNVAKKKFSYNGFNIDCPELYNFGMLHWNTETKATLHVKNNGTEKQKILTITQADDARLQVITNPQLPCEIAAGETVELELTFVPDGTTKILNAKISVVFECYIFDILVDGTVSAPGLLADNLDFKKVRLNSSKTLKGKIFNAGNINIIVREIQKNIEEPVFNYALSKGLPNNLIINDSINYSVNFIPTELKKYIVTSTVKNDANLSCSFIVQGEGAAPNIEDVILDWGRHRLGTTTDTTIYIVNTGNFDDTVNFKNKISLTHEYDRSVDTIHKLNNRIIFEKNRVPIKFSYDAQDTLAMNNVFEISSSWLQHKPIYVTVKAQGTLPVIKVNNYDFGIVPIYSNQKHAHAIINSLGNELLTVDSIVIISGDTNSFIIDYSQLKDLKIATNDSYICPITFIPEFLGEHRILLEITHDANFSYLRSRDTVEIVGICVSDNPDFNFRLELSDIYACQKAMGELIIENNGSSKMLLDSIVLFCSSNDFSANFVDSIAKILPLELNPKEKIIFPIEIYAERNKNGILNIKVYYNKETVIPLSASISPIVTTIKNSLILSSESVLPGDTILVLFRSDIIKKSEKSFNFVIKLQLNKKNFYVLEKKCYIKFLIGTKENILQASVKQIDNFVEFEIPESAIKIDTTTSIEFNIKLLCLLSDEKNTQISFDLISERCYDSEGAAFDIAVNPICADNLRQLVFDGFPYLLIKENPAEDNIGFTINLIEEDAVSIFLTDLSGSVLYEKTNLHLAKGKHNFELQSDDKLNSVYFVTIKSKNLNITKKIIIKK